MPRWQLVISDARVSELTALMEVCGITTQKDLLNSALTFFEWAVEERKRGRIIASVDEENMKYKELAMPALNAVRPQEESKSRRQLALAT